MNKLDFIYALAEAEAQENNLNFTEEVIDLLFLNIPTNYTVQELEGKLTRQFRREAVEAIEAWVKQ